MAYHLKQLKAIASIISRTGKAAVVHDKIISDMISSMELWMPRQMPSVPEWDLGIVLQALSKPPYEPLQEASLKYLTHKTIFLLAMASAGRRSELQAFEFDSKYFQFKPKVAGVTYILAQISCTRIRNLLRLTTPGIFQGYLLVVWSS